MKNWKTALFGLLASVGMAINGGAAGTPSNTWVNIAQILQVAGTLGLGLASKDKDVTGVGAGATRDPRVVVGGR